MLVLSRFILFLSPVSTANTVIWWRAALYWDVVTSERASSTVLLVHMAARERETLQWRAICAECSPWRCALVEPSACTPEIRDWSRLIYAVNYEASGGARKLQRLRPGMYASDDPRSVSECWSGQVRGGWECIDRRSQIPRHVGARLHGT